MVGGAHMAGFLIGLFIGVLIGYIACAILVANTEAERRDRDVHREESAVRPPLQERR